MEVYTFALSAGYLSTSGGEGDLTTDQQLQLLTTELEAARQRLVLQDALVDETKVTSCTCTGK